MQVTLKFDVHSFLIQMSIISNNIVFLQEYESKSEDIDNSSSGTESDADEKDGGVFSGTAMPEDPATMRQKRASLTHTLMENLGTLTSDGFHNLMASYRDPSSPVNKVLKCE